MRLLHQRMLLGLSHSSATIVMTSSRNSGNNIGAYIILNTSSGAPFLNYIMMGPKTFCYLSKAPTLFQMHSQSFLAGVYLH